MTTPFIITTLEYFDRFLNSLKNFYKTGKITDESFIKEQIFQSLYLPSKPIIEDIISHPFIIHNYIENIASFICQDNNPLFVTWDGKPMHPYTLTQWFPKFLRRSKLPHLNFHGLRHTSASFLISKGMDIQTVSGRLGHSTSATTHNIYSHFLESKDRQAAELMKNTFSKNTQISIIK